MGICKSDLSVLMQRIIDRKITFMISQSGINKDYNLYFAAHTDQNRYVRMGYDEQKGIIYHCADENHNSMKFSDVDDVISFVVQELKITEEK